MKCPKCGYLGFETTERCRNCGYDFSLSVHIESSPELPMRGRGETEAPLSDFDLSGLDTSSPTIEPTAGLDLDRIIGATDPAELTPARHSAPRAAQTTAAVATPPPEDMREQYEPAVSRPAPPVESPAPRSVKGLPLLLDQEVSPPRPARPPLAVRRTTPEMTRRRTPRTIRRDDTELALQLDSSAASAAGQATHRVAALEAASRPRRIAGALLDLTLLAAIDGAVLYLTLAIAGLSFDAVGVIPPIPMAAFLLLLNGGYLIAFTAANGQTIGKMIAGIRVIGDDGGRVDFTGAVFRSAGIILSLLALGLPYLPALVADDGRARHDRLAGTRVVRR